MLSWRFGEYYQEWREVGIYLLHDKGLFKTVTWRLLGAFWVFLFFNNCGFQEFWINANSKFFFFFFCAGGKSVLNNDKKKLLELWDDDEDMLRLIGYNLNTPFLGWIAEGHPLAVLGKWKPKGNMYWNLLNIFTWYDVLLSNGSHLTLAILPSRKRYILYPKQPCIISEANSHVLPQNNLDLSAVTSCTGIGISSYEAGTFAQILCCCLCSLHNFFQRRSMPLSLDFAIRFPPPSSSSSVQGEDLHLALCHP